MTDEKSTDTVNLVGKEPEEVGYKKPPKSGQFKKGYDPRRRLSGVPKEAIAARKLIRKIGAELVHVKEKLESGETVEYDITRATAMIRLMFSSRAPADKQTLLKALWPGLLRDENITVDYTKLTDEQLDRIIAGEDVLSVLSSTPHRTSES
jgi:hypothetical protein